MSKILEKQSMVPLLRLAEVSAILGCSVKTITRRISSGDLPVFRDGRMVRVHPGDLARYIKLRREG